jgi:hypothetical protein
MYDNNDRSTNAELLPCSSLGPDDDDTDAEARDADSDADTYTAFVSKYVCMCGKSGNDGDEASSDVK